MGFLQLAFKLTSTNLQVQPLDDGRESPPYMGLHTATQGQVFDPGLTNVHTAQQTNPQPAKHEYRERGYFGGNCLEKWPVICLDK